MPVVINETTKFVRVTQDSSKVVITVLGDSRALTLSFVKQARTLPKTFEKRYAGDGFAECFQESVSAGKLSFGALPFSAGEIVAFRTASFDAAAGAEIQEFVIEAENADELWRYLDTNVNFPEWVKGKISNPFLKRNHRNYPAVAWALRLNGHIGTFSSASLKTEEQIKSEKEAREAFYSQDDSWGLF